MKLAVILDAMREGAVLHFSLADRPRGELYQPGTIATISSKQARSLLKRGAIEGAGDTLFTEVPSQTWRYDGPRWQRCHACGQLAIYAEPMQMDKLIGRPVCNGGAP